MRAARVVQHGDIRLHQASEVVDFARVIGTQLDHGERLLAQPAERQRHADRVVEIAACRQHIAAARQDGGGHLLQRGLPVAAGDRDHARRAALPPLLAETSQSKQAVRHFDGRQRRFSRALHQSAGSATCLRCCKVVVAVEIRTAQRNEQLALLQAAGIGADTVDEAIVTCQMTVDHRRELGQVQCAHAAPREALPGPARYR